jgi:hypothetical protein
MIYWTIILIAFIALSYCISYAIKKKYHAKQKGYGLFALIFLLIWASLLLGLYLSTCLKI